MIERHILGLSGGRDSAALAVWMRENRPELELEYFFTDTGKELPEVYDFLDRLEGFLGRPILYQPALITTHEPIGGVRWS